MVILGIDPGTATTGFGVIKIEKQKIELLDYGCIETPKTLKLPERLNQIAQDLEELVRMWQPDSIAIEELFFSKNVKTAMHVAHARGAIMQKLSSEGYEIHEYKPQTIKESVCSYGKAEKLQVQKMVKMILHMDHLPEPDDAADALACAICHAQHVNFTNLVTQSL